MEDTDLLAASNARKLFSKKHATYARFIAFVRYPQGLRAFFRRSSLLRSGIRVLDAGCGTGAATVALLDALVHRGVTPGSLHAFDLTPAMLQRFGQTLERLKIPVVEVRQANVLNMDARYRPLGPTTTSLSQPPCWNTYRASGRRRPWRRFGDDLPMADARN